MIGNVVAAATHPEGIFWLGEAVDRLDATHLTFPGGYRNWARAPEFVGAHHGARTWKRGPEFVVTGDDARLDVAPLPGRVRADAVARIFGVHRWSFAADDGRAGDRALAG